MTVYTTSYATTDYATANARSLFAQVICDDFVCKLIRGLRGHRALTALSTTLAQTGSVAREARQVPLKRIVGSVNGGRTREFDADFRPMQRRTRDRWLSVAEARQRGKQLPPVELVEVDGEFYIVDGHHRISVAAAMQDTHIDAVVASVG